jgi:hypothetical protein
LTRLEEEEEGELRMDVGRFGRRDLERRRRGTRCGFFPWWLGEWARETSGNARRRETRRWGVGITILGSRRRR